MSDLEVDPVALLTGYGVMQYEEQIEKVFRDTNAFEPFELDEWLNECLFPHQDYRWCIYTKQDKIIGAACFGPIMKERPGRYDLYWIAVDPAYQGQGIGKKLLTRTEEEAKKQGASHMYIETGSWNDSGNALYGACGYKLMGVLEEYYNDTNHKHIWGKKL